jgi:hypothetical protein
MGLPPSNTVVSVAQKIAVGIFWERSIGWGMGRKFVTLFDGDGV